METITRSEFDGEVLKILDRITGGEKKARKRYDKMHAKNPELWPTFDELYQPLKEEVEKIIGRRFNVIEG